MSLNVQTLMPAVVSPSSQTIVADIDNDGYLEVIILDANSSQLAIVHQFSYNQFTLNEISSTVWPATDPNNTTPIWTDSTVRWWTAWTAQQGLVPPQAGDGWTIALGDVIMAGDLDGDGVDELFIYNLTTLFWGILKWNSTTNELQTVYKINVGPTDHILPVGELKWVAAPADQYIMFPNLHGIIPTVPENVTGILLFNTQTLFMGMIWFEGIFWQPWLIDTSTPIPGWSRAGSNEWFPAPFADATQPSLTVYDPDEYIALLTWNNSQFSTPSAQGSSAGNWGFDSADQHQCADLDGDGMAEILVFNPNTQYLGALKWESGQLQSLAVENGTIGTAPNDWTISSDNKYYLLNIPGGSAQIFAYSPSATKVAVLAYQSNPNQSGSNPSGTFVVKWAGTSLLPNNGWPVTANDSFYVGLPSQSNAPRFFTLSTQGPATNPAFTLGAATWDGTNLQIVSSATLPVQAWSPAFLASAPPAYVNEGPPTNFPAFQGVQQDIYTYLSGVFPAPGPPTTSVRAAYSNLNFTGYFQPYVTSLQSVTDSPSQAPNTWPPPNSAWQNSDWQPVVNTLIQECLLVIGVNTFFANLSSLGGDLFDFQTTDLQTVNQYIGELAQNGGPSNVDYWVGQGLVAVLWGMAAAAGVIFPEGAELAAGILLSTSASFVGSALAYNPTQQSSLAVGQMQLQLGSAFDQSIVSTATSQSACLQDAIKLKICAGLLGTEWAIPSSLPTSIPPLTALDRMFMYQQLMPFFFTILYGPMDAPWPLKSPSVLYTAPDGTHYGMQDSFDSIDPSDFTHSNLYQDLFTTIGVSQEDFFVGNGGWSLIARRYVL